MIDGREKWKCQFGFKLQNSPVFEKTSAVSIKRHDNKFNFNTIFIKIQTLQCGEADQCGCIVSINNVTEYFEKGATHPLSCSR